MLSASGAVCSLSSLSQVQIFTTVILVLFHHRILVYLCVCVRGHGAEGSDMKSSASLLVTEPDKALSGLIERILHHAEISDLGLN